ncbi:FMN-binding negative transcriptional regulator [Formosa sp. S-31]|uniref:FMN-binding negative transcriptional regulator n=1 Tax=Formosa sp. S-31 TaxID=2790949 RepID=UPI003EC12F69
MSYPPKIYQEPSKSVMLEVIKHYPLATLISVKEHFPIITHIPLIYDNGKLIGHIDKFNPQADLLRNGRPVTAIFSGPDCYISPSLFDGSQLPTWNYIKVHIQGKAIAINDALHIKETMVAMTESLEHPEHLYRLTMDNTKMEQFINYVVGFEIEITNWEGKFKVSQDKTEGEQQIAKEALIASRSKNQAILIDKIIS